MGKVGDPYLTAGVALAGAGLLRATPPSTPSPAPVPAVRLASVDAMLVPLSPPCSLGATIGCSTTDTLFGTSFVGPSPNALLDAAGGGSGAGNPPADPVFALIGLAGQIPILNIFIANGANAPLDCMGAACNGGNAGLLIGYGGRGGNGAPGVKGGPGQPGGNGGKSGTGGFAGTPGTGGIGATNGLPATNAGGSPHGPNGAPGNHG
jgi:hypothetical protein